MTSSDRPAESPLITGLVASPAVRWIALIGLCAAYLQGALTKAFDFPAPIAEMQNFGLAPAAPFAVLVIGFELCASALILSGFYRWLGALALAGFTLAATFGRLEVVKVLVAASSDVNAVITVERYFAKDQSNVDPKERGKTALQIIERLLSQQYGTDAPEHELNLDRKKVAD